MPLIWIAAGCFVFFLLVSHIRAYVRLSHIPGPVIAGWTQLNLVRWHFTGRSHEILASVCEKYGPLVRIGPNELLTNDANVWRMMTAPRSGFVRSEQYLASRFEAGKDSIVTTRDEKWHSELRKKMAIGYSGKENEGLEDSVDRSIYALINLLEQKYVSRAGTYKQADFARVVSFFTLDVITDIAFGESWGDLRDDEDKYDWLKETRLFMPALTTFMILPSWYILLDRLGIIKALGPTSKDKRGFGSLLGLAKRTAEARYNEHAKVQADMLGSFIKHGLSQEEAEAESMVQVIAGSDTSATAIRATLLYIITSPLAYRKLQDEIDSGIAEGKVSSPTQNAEADKLPYLQACIKESLRLMPPLVTLQAKVVPKGGKEICGKFVPEGTQIGYSAVGIHRNKSIFGQDVDLFRPDRWMEAQGEQLEKMERNNELVFSYGRFVCLGKNIVHMEMNKVIVELMRRYDFTVENPQKPWRSLAFGLHLQDQMYLYIRKRDEK